MYLKKSKQGNGRIYLSITEGFRVKGKVKSRTVEKCGYLDELEKIYDNPIEHFMRYIWLDWITGSVTALSEQRYRASGTVLLDCRNLK